MQCATGTRAAERGGRGGEVILGKIFPRKGQDICFLGKVPKFGMKNI